MVDNTDPFWPEMDQELVIITYDDVNTAKRELQEVLENGTLTSAAGHIKDYLEKVQNVELNIAVTGEAGSGKSTFINAIRGLDDEAEESAPTGVVETTMQVTAYPHPKYPNVQFWDLPGVGTPNFKQEDYLQKVEFGRYDFFIIISSVRFRNNDVLLAKEIQKMNRRFYFVRSKIDASLEAEKRKKNFNPDETLKQIKENSIQGLEKEGLGSPKVFLVSSFHLQLYDFPVLEETMEKELPDHKKEVLLMSIPNLTLEINQRKRNALGASVWKAAFISGIAGAVPFPGVSIFADIKILKNEIEKYYQAFGLDNKSLQNLADKVDLTVEELNAVIKSPLHSELSHDYILKCLTKAAGGGLIAANFWKSTFPVFGSLAAGGLAFGTTYHMLKTCLNELAEDAKNVLMKSLKLKTETK